jgi:hypothetical protein
MIAQRLLSAVLDRMNSARFYSDRIRDSGRTTAEERWRLVRGEGSMWYEIIIVEACER